MPAHMQCMPACMLWCEQGLLALSCCLEAEPREQVDVQLSLGLAMLTKCAQVYRQVARPAHPQCTAGVTCPCAHQVRPSVQARSAPCAPSVHSRGDLPLCSPSAPKCTGKERALRTLSAQQG